MTNPWASRRASAPRHWYVRRLVFAVVVTVAGVTAFATASSASTSLNVTGTYSSVYHCQTGYCAGQDYPATTVFTQAQGSNIVFNGPNQGTLNGDTLTMHEGTTGYTFDIVLVFSPDGRSYSGTLKDSNNTSGIETGTLESAQNSTPTLTGTWNCCGAGGASVQNFIINGATGIAQFPGGSDFANLTATLVGNQATIVSTYTQSTYVATFKGTLSGSTLTGTWSSNANQTGTFTATLAGASTSTTTTTIPTTPGNTGSVGHSQVLPLAATLSTPGEIFHSMSHNLLNAAVTVGVIIFITFPANIFNRTFSANYDEILLIMARWRRRLRRLLTSSEPESDAAPATTSPSPVDETPGKVTPGNFALVLLLGAVLGGLLNPHFGLNRSSIEGIVATLIAFSVGAVLSWFVAKTFREHHQYPTLTYLQALPLGLLIAIICVLVSRMSHFEPGYLYGVVVGLSFAGSLKSNHNAHLTAIGIGSTLVVALAAWLAWIPVNHLALSHGTNAIIVVCDDVLGSIFVGGLVGSVISLIPIDLLPGKVIAQWHRGVWAVIFFIATFLLIEVELRPASGPTHPGHASLVTVVVLFLLFGGGTFWMRWYFERRTKTNESPSNAVAASVEETESS